MGKRKIDCANLGVPQLDNLILNPDVPANSDERHTLEMEGAIQSQNTQFQEWGMDGNDFPNDFQEKLQEFLITRIGALDHIVSCVHFDFVWEEAVNNSAS